MSDIDVLQELIKKEATVPLISASYGKNSAILKEEGQYSVKIKGIPKEAIVIKTDTFPPPDGLFACQRGECRRADFVIVTNSSQDNFILYIEMKKGRSKWARIVDQLRGSACLMSYCRDIGRAFWQRMDFLGRTYKSRFISIREIRINRKPTIEPSQNGLNDTPEKALKIKGKRNLHFRELVLRK